MGRLSTARTVNGVQLMSYQHSQETTRLRWVRQCAICQKFDLASSSDETFICLSCARPKDSSEPMDGES
jgi:hypothetical protein